MALRQDIDTANVRTVQFGLALMLLVCAASGCGSGPAIGQVAGRVTFQGQPVTEGTVTFFNAETGLGGEGTLESDGAFTIKYSQGGLPIGDYVVTIQPGRVLDKSDPSTPPVWLDKPASNIPSRFRGQESPLRATVTEGKNDFPFELTP